MTSNADANTNPSAPTPLAELSAALVACERYVSGHGRIRPRDVLAQLMAEVGPDERADAYGEGAALQAFEAEIAALLGKPAAVFLPSGTMAQQIAARLWADRRGVPSVAWHPTCHLEIHEQRGYQLLHGLHARLVGDARRVIGRADLDAVRDPIAMLLLELPQREIGGALPAWHELESQIAWARERGIALHLDGARVWECLPYYAPRSLADIAGLFDSVYVSFYKILGGIAGAVLAGSADFIADARLWQRRHGGNLVTMWPLLAAARLGLREKLPRVTAYHERAVSLARALSAIDGVAVKPNPPPTNMMHVALRAAPAQVIARATEIARRDRIGLCRAPRATDVPGWSMIELYVGEATFALTDAEIARAFAAVVA